MFVTQFEDTSSIAEALQLINQWNPDWKPESFVVDYCEAEMTAIEMVFPGKHYTIELLHDFLGIIRKKI